MGRNVKSSFFFALLLSFAALSLGARYKLDLGAFVNDAAALADLQQKHWDTAGDGSGTAQQGMCYYNTTDDIHHCWDGAAWIESDANSAALHPGDITDTYIPQRNGAGWDSVDPSSLGGGAGQVISMFDSGELDSDWDFLVDGASYNSWDFTDADALMSAAEVNSGVLTWTGTCSGAVGYHNAKLVKEFPTTLPPWLWPNAALSWSWDATGTTGNVGANTDIFIGYLTSGDTWVRADYQIQGTGAVPGTAKMFIASRLTGTTDTGNVVTANWPGEANMHGLVAYTQNEGTMLYDDVAVQDEYDPLSRSIGTFSYSAARVWSDIADGNVMSVQIVFWCNPSSTKTIDVEFDEFEFVIW